MSLAERVGSLGALRLGFVLVAVAFVAFAPGIRKAPLAELTAGSAAYLLLLLVPRAIERQPRNRALWIVAGSLLVDGGYLAWLTYATGGAQSPLRFLVLVHVVAVTLLASYRTGLKVAAWHSLLFVVVPYAQASGLLPLREATAALPGGPEYATASVLQVSAIWVVALATATCSALNERELRAQKVDLQELSAMVRDLDRRAGAAEIPAILLESLCRVFGFSRGAVLASPEGDLSVMAHHGTGVPPTLPVGLDRVMEGAWNERRTQLVRALDPEGDPCLAALLPGARDVLVVPLFVDGGYGLGIVALEHRSRRHHIKHWVVTMVEQFASHAALTLNNAWLNDQLEQRLEENRALQQELLEQNLRLEVKVQERTEDLSRSLHDLQVVDEQRRRLLARLVHAEEDERQRIAGDIHDDPIQKLVAASMRLQLLRRSLSDPDQLAELEKLLAVVRSSIGSLRHMIFELRPHALDEEGLGPAIREYLESLEADFESRVTDELEQQPPESLRVLLYRMAQEALNNAHKHAQAEHVEVLLAERDGGFLVQIADDGVGFSVPEAPRSERGHLGLTSLRERAEMAGGWCRLLSRPGEGTTVELWVPGRPAASREVDEDRDVDVSQTVVLDAVSASRASGSRPAP